MADMIETARRAIEEHAEPFAHAVGLTELPPFAPLLIASAVGWWTLHVVVAPVLSSIFFPGSYGRLRTARERNNWNIRVVSLTHAILVLPIALRNLHLPALDADHAFGWDPRAGKLVAIACGYFLWDTFESIIHFSDIGFVVHGLACFFIYFLTYKPFILYYAARFLLWELSTPFLNFHWFFDKMNLTGSIYQIINGVLLLSTFAGSRLVYGFYQSYTFYQTLYSIRDQFPRWILVMYGVGNIVLCSLNIIWFQKMIAALQKRVVKNPQKVVNGKAANGKLVNGKKSN